jgi:hypothetical protein
LKSICAAALLACSGAAFATPVAYTSLTSFMSVTSGAGTDTFDNVSITTSTSTPLARTAGVYGYTATATDGAFFGAGSDPDHWLSTDSATASIVFSGFSSGVQAVGGFFFGSDVFGAYAPGSILLSATDATGTISQLITAASTTSFIGFLSSGGLTSLTVTAVEPGGDFFLWPTVNSLVLSAAVPEPSTYALILAGLAALGWSVRRRTGIARPFAC